MTPVPGPGKEALLIGIEAFLPPASPLPPGHLRAGALDGGGWYFLRHPDASYELHAIGAGPALVATRAIAASPFADDPDRIYFAGYDANKQPAHDTAWIPRATQGRVLLPSAATAR